MPYVHISDSALNVRDVWRDGVWNLNELITQLDDGFSHQILNHRICLHLD